ncbi:MAG TPA: prepilin peptidase [Candidatus Sulfotelmatobacter sp.]|nr:prepilin peptidase [Candidatus Sulfotelmatobacter sp.]
MILFCLAVLAICLLAAAWSDFVSYTIPNRLSAVLALAGLAAVVLGDGGFAAVPRQAGLALAMLAAGAAMFFLRLWGAGDAKLLAALALWAPPEGLPVLLIWTVLSGGLLSLLIILARRLLPRNWRGLAVLSPDRGVPYGIAIAVGGFALILSRHSVIADTFFLS